jgi:hypothetical protein
VSTIVSSSWAIGEAAAVGGGKGKGGGGIALYTLIDVDNQIIYPLYIGSAGVSGGIPFQITISAPGDFSFFTTSSAIPADDFRGLVCFGEVLDFSIIVGGSIINCITFHGVDHRPYWIDTSGLENGISASIIGVSFGYAYVGKGITNSGCDIRAGGDPLCGGYSPNPNQSQDPNQSQRP